MRTSESSCRWWTSRDNWSGGAAGTPPLRSPFTPRPGPRRPPPAAVLPTSTLPATSAAGPAPPTPSRSAPPSPAGGARAPPAAARPGRGPRRPPLRSALRRPPGRAREARRRSGAGARGSCWRASPSPIRGPPIRRVRCAGARTSGRSALNAAFPERRSRSALSRRRLGLRGGRQLPVLRAGLPQLLLEPVGSGRIAAQRVSSLLAARADPLAADLEPSAALLDQVALDGQVEQLVRPRDAYAVEDVELGLPERRGHLVLHHLHPGAVPDHLLAVLDGADAPDVEADGGIELERISAGGRLGRAEHHADLHADLVDEDHGCAIAADHRRELAQGLRHEPRLQTHVRVAHLSLDLRLGHQRGHRVDHHQVDRAGAHQRLRDFQRLLAGVRLGNEEVLDLHAQLARVRDVERVLGVDEGRASTLRLYLRDGVQGQRSLAGALGSKDLDYASSRVSAAPERQIEAERSSRDGGDGLRHLGLAEPHHRTLTELLLDGPDGRRDGLQLLRNPAHVPSLGSPAGSAPGVRCTAAPRAS